MEFTVENKMDYRQMVLLNRVVEKTFRKWVSLFFRLGIFLIGLYMMMLGILVVVYGDWRASLAMVLVSLVWGCLMAVYAVIPSHLSGALSKWRMLKGAEKTLATFDSDGFTEETIKGKTRRPYSAVYAVVRCQGIFFLFFDKKHACILPEAGFVQGSAERFPAWIERKTGKTVQFLK